MKESKQESLERTRFIRAYNLQRAMEDKGIKAADLLRKAKLISTHYFDMSPQTLSMILHGKRTLQPEYAEVFAEVLGVSPGYLMGWEMSQQGQQFMAYRNDAKPYNLLLNQINASISGYPTIEIDGKEVLKGYTVIYGAPDVTLTEAADRLGISESELTEAAGNKTTYHFTSDADIVEVSLEEMERFYQDVCSFIKKRFDILVALSEKEV